MSIIKECYFFLFAAVMVLCHFAEANGQREKFSDSENQEEFSLKSELFAEEEIIWNNDSPILVWWTDSLFPDRNRKSVSKISCKFGECLTTLNRDYLSNRRTRGILFYGTNISPGDLPLPRQPLHEWALFHEESPLNNYILCHQSFIRLFNHTATCRRQSDFPLTLQWILDDDYLTSRQPLPVSIKNQLKHEKGFAPVLYIQSHCDVPSDRDRYIKSLMDHISIDSYGKCLNNRKLEKKFEDPVENLFNPKFLNFIAQYKFHIAFENSFLDDYMTEKLMRAYHVGSVPIYKGAPTAKDWRPSNTSLIFIDDFESPEHLANFIKQLDENDDDYNAYLQYKEEGITNPMLLHTLDRREWRFNNTDYPSMIQSYECFVCDEINKRMKAEKDGMDIPVKFANQSHFGCQQPYTLLLDPHNVSTDDSWHNIDWIDMYWRAFDDSLAVNAMLKAGETDSSRIRQYLTKIYERRRKS